MGVWEEGVLGVVGLCGFALEVSVMYRYVFEVREFFFFCDL